MSDRTTLKSYFQTGDKPTQSEFFELIDSMALTEEATAAQTSANDAQSLATEAYAHAYKSFVKATLNQGGTWTLNRAFNVASVATGTAVTGGRIVTITFSSAFPDSNYVVSALLNHNGLDPATRNVCFRDQAATSINLVVVGLNTNTSIHFVAFDVPIP